ncbi:ATP-dependent RNA helicase SUV3L, mitochondrial [Galdieria sulphuraria]|nr:ATP-dependent RNA helicase SUV3L, mitochondrial [Galdieria sulphuraria]
MLHIYTRYLVPKLWVLASSCRLQLGYSWRKPLSSWYSGRFLNLVAKEKLPDTFHLPIIAKSYCSNTLDIKQKDSDQYAVTSLESDRERYFVKKVKPLSDKEREKIRYLLREYVIDDTSYQEKAIEIGISKEIYPRALRLFRKHVHEATGRKELYTREDVELYNVVLKALSQDDDIKALEELFPSFIEYTKQYFPEEIQVRNRMREYADLRLPHLLFPEARKRRRKIVYHFGPTNSGKTYFAMERLKSAKNGVYAGPLRLLAWEAFEKMNADGVFTNLMTGEEKKIIPFASHIACTIEMLSTEEEYEVAVLDEIQMIGDAQRGWSWTRGLLGVQASEVHVCGDPSTKELLKQLAQRCGDEFEEKEYFRQTSLEISRKSLNGDLNKLQDGDTIVVFSRRDVYETKYRVEQTTGKRCCVIYGSLPPETRSYQARLFNDPESEYKILVATDAIGMGLNLNIKRIIFASLEKFHGLSSSARKEPLSFALIRQIAGRAGRAFSIYPHGEATCLYEHDIPRLQEAFQGSVPSIDSAGLMPTLDQMELFASVVGDNVKLSTLLDLFAEYAKLDNLFSLCEQKFLEMRRIARLLQQAGTLSLKEQFEFCQAPVNISDPFLMKYLLSFAKNVATGSRSELTVRPYQAT